MQPEPDDSADAIEYLVTRTVHNAVGRLAGACLAMLVAGGCAAAGMGCVLTALWLFLLPHVGSIGAPLAVGGVLLVVSLAVATSSRILRSYRPPVPLLDILPALAMAEATSLLKGHKASALIAAVLAGLTSGRLEPK